MRTFSDFLWDRSIIYFAGMSDEELDCRLQWMEAADYDEFLFAAVPVPESKKDIKAYTDQCRWQQVRPPAVVWLPKIHISIRFNRATLVRHIEELKDGIDRIEAFKKSAPVIIEGAKLIGEHSSLFSLMFPRNDPSLNKANNFFNRIYKTVTSDPKTFPLIPHMVIAKYVTAEPIGIENYPPSINVFFALVHGKLWMP